MLLRHVGDSVRRRWYVTLIGVILTIGLSAATFVRFPPSYELTASVTLIPPESATDPSNENNGTNPYLNLGDLGQMRDLLSTSLQSKGNAEDVKAAVPGGEFTITTNDASSGPVVNIVADADSRESVAQVMTMVLDRVGTTLTNLQKSLSVPSDQQITSQVLTKDSKAEPINKTRLRVAIVAAALGFLLTLVGTLLIDRRLTRRSKNRANAADVESDTDPAVSPSRAVGPANREDAGPQDVSTTARPDEPAPTGRTTKSDGPTVATPVYRTRPRVNGSSVRPPIEPEASIETGDRRWAPRLSIPTDEHTAAEEAAAVHESALPTSRRSVRSRRVVRRRPQPDTTTQLGSRGTNGAPLVARPKDAASDAVSGDAVVEPNATHVS